MKFLMKMLLILILALLPLSVIAQTMDETEQWIIEKVNVSRGLGLSYKINDDVLVSEVSSMDLVDERTIPIASITSISYVQTDKYLTFFLTCEDDCAYFVQTDSDGTFKEDGKRSKFLLEMYGKIDPEIIPRLQKALLHLIELHGGKAKLVAYQKPKEAF